MMSFVTCVHGGLPVRLFHRALTRAAPLLQRPFARLRAGHLGQSLVMASVPPSCDDRRTEAGADADDDDGLMLDEDGWAALEAARGAPAWVELERDAETQLPPPLVRTEAAEAAIKELMACKFQGAAINDMNAVSLRVFRPTPGFVTSVDVNALLEPLLTYWLALYKAATKEGVYISSDNDRIALIYLKASPGVGKTHFFNLLCRVQEIVESFDRLPAAEQRRLKQHREALEWASSNVVFPLSFNGLCRIDVTVEAALVKMRAKVHDGLAPYLPALLRFLFVALFPFHTKASWLLFRKTCSEALKAGKLTAADLNLAVDKLFRRLQDDTAGGSVVLLVDEIGACDGLPKGSYKPNSSAGEGMRTFLSDFAEQRSGPASFSSLMHGLMTVQSTPLSIRPVVSGYSLQLVSPIMAARFLLPALQEFYRRGSQLVVGGKVAFGSLRDRDQPLDSIAGRARLSALARYCSATTCGHARLLAYFDLILRSRSSADLSLDSDENTGEDLGKLLDEATKKSGLMCSSLTFGDKELVLVATLFLGSLVDTTEKVRVGSNRMSWDQLGVYGKVILSGEDVCRPLLPASSFVGNVRKSRSSGAMMAALKKMVARQPNDIGSIWEDFHLWWEVAASQARALIHGKTSNCTVSDVYATSREIPDPSHGPLPSRHNFCGKGDVLRKMELHFAIPKTTVAARDLTVLLKMAEDRSKHRELLQTVWRTSAGHPGVDGVMFVSYAADYAVRKTGDLFMILLSLKSTSPGMDGAFSKSTIEDGWNKTKAVFGPSWERWADRHALVFVLRRRGSTNLTGKDRYAASTVVCDMDGLEDVYGRVVRDVAMSLELLHKTELLF